MTTIYVLLKNGKQVTFYADEAEETRRSIAFYTVDGDGERNLVRFYMKSDVRLWSVLERAVVGMLRR